MGRSVLPRPCQGAIGREMTHTELGMKVLDRVRDDLEELAKVEQRPKMEGRQMTMVISPR